MDRVGAESLDRRVAQHALQRPAVDRELRDGVAGIGAAQLVPDLLPEAVAIEELIGAHTDRVEAFQQAEVGKHGDRVGKRVDPDTELADLRRLLEHAALQTEPL